MGSLPVLVMVASFSRFIAATMIPSRTTVDLLAGHWRLLTGLEAVPGRIIWKNEAGIGRGRKLTVDARAFAGSPAIRFVLLKAFDPESKGIVERVNRFLETSLLPGRAFSLLADFNAQLTGWLTVANTRRVRRWGPQIRLRLITRPVIQPIRCAITVTGIDGVTHNNSRTRGSTGVNAVATCGREYSGGRSDANARSTVTRKIPNLRAISLLLNPSQRFRALSSPQFSI